MATVGVLIIPPELQALWARLFDNSDNRKKGAVRKHGYLLSRKKVRDVSTRSLLPQIAALKKTLSPAQVLAWKSAGLASNQNYYSLFVQDTSYRIKYGIAGLATPSSLHAYKVGRVEVNAPASRVALVQYHPPKFYINKKMRGNTTVYENVAITERLVLPLTISISYRSNLTATTGTPRVRYYAVIKSSYQGRTIETETSCELHLVAGWTRASVTCATVIGVARSYDLHIDIVGARGMLEFDNVSAYHTGTNYARDKRCNDVNNTLTRLNYQIEKSWEETFLPAGAAFDSVYPTD
jgi:hypothetical protein